MASVVVEGLISKIKAQNRLQNALRNNKKPITLFLSNSRLEKLDSYLRQSSLCTKDSSSTQSEVLSEQYSTFP